MKTASFFSHSQRFNRLLTQVRRLIKPRLLRQGLVAVLSAALVLTALPMVRRVNSPVQAQIITSLRTCNPNHPFASGQIIQNCKLDSGTGGAAEAELENGVINDLLKVHRLPWSDRGQLLGWERNLIRAGVLNRIVSIIKKNPAERTAWEQTVFMELTQRVKERRMLATDKAYQEYLKWATTCPYTPPAPFTWYDRPECGTGLSGLIFRPSPSFAEFAAYGSYLANAELNDTTQQVIMRDTARALGVISGLVGAGLAASIGAFFYVSLAVVFTTITGPLSTMVIGGTAPTVTTIVGGSVAGAIAAPIAIIIFAAIAGALVGFVVFTQAEIEPKLREARDLAASPTNLPNLTELVQTEAGLNEIFAEFIQATLPDFPATTGAPPMSASNPQFEFRLVSASDFSPTASIEYQDWEGKLHTVRLSGGWFVDRKGSEEERLTLSIQFINHQGRNRQASRSGGQFVISDISNDKAAPQLTNELQYLNGNFEKYVARIPNIIPVITAIPVMRPAEPPAPETEWDLLTSSNKPTTYNVSHIANIIDNDSIAVLNVAITSPLTSNGVTLSEFRVEADGKVKARIQPSCSATDADFTLSVTDTANVTTTETIHVTVTPNQPPLLEYGSPYMVPEHGSLEIAPTVWPSDDNTAWPTLPLPTKVLTFDQPVITSQTFGAGAFTGTLELLTDFLGNPTGTIKVSNAGPTGLYAVSVTVKDNCEKATTKAFFLSVRCASPALTYSSTNPTCPGAHNGLITLNASGGAGGLLYSINSGQNYQSNNVFTGLASGSYFVTVKDSTSCAAATQKVTLTDPAPVTFTTSSANPSCNGASNGQITINGSGGTGGLSYSIYSNNSAQSYQIFNVNKGLAAFNHLAAGDYVVSVKDENGCAAATQKVTLTNPTSVIFTPASANPTCNGASNGRIVIHASGGAGTFFYSIGGGNYQSSNDFMGLAAGKYSVSVKDVNGCVAPAQEVTLTNPAPVNAQVSGGGALCPGGSATITVNLTGGTAPYTVKLSDGQTKTSGLSSVTFRVSPSAPTTYTATATDNYGCPVTVSGSATVTPDHIAPVINAPAAITIDGASSGGATVSFSVTATDNCGALSSFSLSKPSGSFFPFGATVVTATATDRNGNRSQASFTVTVRTLQQQASLINTQVQALVTAGALTVNQGTGLSDKLAEVTAKLNQGQTNAACNQLNAFINQVNGLPSLTAAQKQSLKNAANTLSTNIGC